jgi:NmrA-like family protein
MSNPSPPTPTADQRGILVIGAGELGRSVLSALSRRNAPDVNHNGITVLLRPSAAPQRTQLRTELAAEGIEIEEADVSTASGSELAAIMGRFHLVVSCVGFSAGPGTQRKLAEAALAAGVPRYVPWQFGVDYDAIGRGSPQDLFDEQLDVRDLLRGQRNTEWIIVSTGMFTSFLFEPSFGVVDLGASAVHALGSWDTEVTVTTAEDIGVLTAEIIHTCPRIANQVVYVAGDTLSYRDLADIVERVGGAPVERTEWTIEHLRDDLEKHPADTMRKYRAVFAEGNGVAWPKESSFNAVNGIRTTGALEWASTHISPK